MNIKGVLYGIAAGLPYMKHQISEQGAHRQHCDDAEHAGERKVRRFEQFPVLVDRALGASLCLHCNLQLL